MVVQVKLRFCGQLKTLVDAPQQVLEVPRETTVVDLFHILSERYGPRFEQRVMEVRQNRPALQRHVLVFINGEKIENEALATTRLGVSGGETGVDVYVMLPFTGG